MVRESRSYKEVLASLETHIEHMRNHLGNIDAHLGRINDKIYDQEKRITGLETDNGNPGRRVNLSKAQAIGIGSGLFLFGSFIAGIIVGLF